MEYRDYYATLGVPRTASQADIKKAFRKLARQHHPDVNASDTDAAERRFKEVNEAYDVLGDPEKRKLYDQLGANWEAYQRGGAGGQGFPGGFPGGGGQGGPFAGFPGGVRFEYRGDPEDLAGFSEFFRTFFAGDMGGASEGPARGGRSGGSRAGGARPGAGASGGGSRAGGGLRIEDLFGGMGGAAGRGGTHAGGSRGGSGNGRQPAGPAGAEADLEVSLEDVASGATARVQVGDKRLEVKVPAGIDTGGRIRLRGKAPDGGDLTLIARVRPHPLFNRSGADVTRELPITLGEALLGAQVPVGTLAGRTLLLTIPAGTQNGRQIRLRGHGLPRFKGEGNGDLIVRTRVVLPDALDTEGQRLARHLVDHVAQPNPRDGRPAEAAHAAHAAGATNAATSATSASDRPAGATAGADTTGQTGA
jgi:DnaJ-class molecular chaperone